MTIFTTTIRSMDPDSCENRHTPMEVLISVIIVLGLIISYLPQVCISLSLSLFFIFYLSKLFVWYSLLL